jgi:predicted nucleic acid-binding protein
VTQWVVVDTGPLVALLDKREQYHVWATEQVERLAPPMLVCEPVLVEATFLLSRLPDAQAALFGMLNNGTLRLAFHLDEHINEVLSLLNKYRDRPMSLADACLVRMAELFERYSIFTLDSDFTVYRRHGRELLKLICPEKT